MCKLIYSSSVKILKNFLFELCYQIIRSAKYPEQSKSMPEIYAWKLSQVLHVFICEWAKLIEFSIIEIVYIVY